MKLLTDTHALVWALAAPRKLSQPARKAVEEHFFTASIINFWELVIKQDRPGALIPDPVAWWQRYVVNSGIVTLGVEIRHIRELARMPELHGDPFDHLLIAQALSEGFTLVTRDAQLARYNIPVIW